jgi:Tannase and feruloyl esterase
MSVAGEAVTRDYYPTRLKYSYFNGCSTGGHEGLMEAQKFPADYNGIVSGSPAINWTKFIPSELWPSPPLRRSLWIAARAGGTSAITPPCTGSIRGGSWRACST